MVTRREAVASGVALAAAVLAGCSTTDNDASTSTSDDAVETATVTPTDETVTPPPTQDGFVGYTHVRPSGNRVIAGRGRIPDTDPLDVSLAGRPAWVVAVPRRGGSDWAVATRNGVVRVVAVRGGSVESTRDVGTYPADSPFAAVTVDGRTRPVDRPAATSRWSHAVPVDGEVLFVGTNGDIVLTGAETRRRSVDALPDARLVRVARRRYALLAGRTERYDHGALGDSVEATRLLSVDVRDGLSVQTVASLDSPAVIEGIAPIAADLTGNGTSDLVVTVADDRHGARLVAFTRDGMRIATGPSFSTGFRWRHQLAVGPFGPSGERELAAVKTPHIGGSARFHRVDDDSLSVVASVDGVSSHALSSRNLDGGLGGDLDGDGAWELLVPTQQRDALVGVRRSVDGASVAWRVSLPGKLASNVTGVTLSDGSAAVGAAGSDGVLRIWHP